MKRGRWKMKKRLIGRRKLLRKKERKKIKLDRDEGKSKGGRMVTEGSTGGE